MRVVALISGGKDSCYNMVQCVAAGHQIVALANLRPENKDELDSYMYQTVGHQGVEMYAEALGLPLFRQMTNGVAVQHGKLYTPTPDDEVEDLYRLLNRVKEEINIEAVAVGAVLSDYQRVRVENVCSRLGLVALAYLWRRDQQELLQEMIDCRVEAIIIKVAALGLDPVKHLGLRISEIQPHLVKMNEKYGLHVCGEGGEYETFTLDCPLFAKALVIEDVETVIHSNDAIAPVGYLNFSKLRLVEKESGLSELSLHERLVHSRCVVKNAADFVSDIDDCDDSINICDSDELEVKLAIDDKKSTKNLSSNEPIGDSLLNESNSINGKLLVPLSPREERVVWESDDVDAGAFDTCVGVHKDEKSGWAWFSGIAGVHEDVAIATRMALEKLSALAKENQYSLSEIIAVCLYVCDMSQYKQINDEYVRVLVGHNPPVRVCVEVPLSRKAPVLVEAVAYSPTLPLDERSSFSSSRQTMHVQGVSHWAPANIGPYSQAIMVGDVLYIAGQIGLIPGSMSLVEGGVLRQCRLALRHISRILKAMEPNSKLHDVVQSVCYVTNAAYITEVRSEWEKQTKNSIVDYVVVSHLPRNALVEWHVWVHRVNSRFEYEETGCVVGDCRVSICRRWNYDNTVSAIVCSVSTRVGSCVSLTSASMSEDATTNGDRPVVSDAQLDEAVTFALSRLVKDVPEASLATVICNVRVFHQVGTAPSPSLIRRSLASASESQHLKVAATFVPVCQLSHPNTFLSVCALRHL